MGRRRCYSVEGRDCVIGPLHLLTQRPAKRLSRLNTKPLVCTALSERGRALPALSTTRSEGRKQFSLASKKYFNTLSDSEKRCEPPLTALLPAQRRDRGSLGPPAPQETAGTGRPLAGGEGERKGGGCTHLASSSSGVAGHLAARRAVTGCEEEAGAVPQGHGRAHSKASRSAGGSSSAQPAMRSSGARGTPSPARPPRPGVCPAHMAMALSYWLSRASALCYWPTRRPISGLRHINSGAAPGAVTRGAGTAQAQKERYCPLRSEARVAPPLRRRRGNPVIFNYFYFSGEFRVVQCESVNYVGCLRLGCRWLRRDMALALPRWPCPAGLLSLGLHYLQTVVNILLWVSSFRHNIHTQLFLWEGDI